MVHIVLSYTHTHTHIQLTRVCIEARFLLFVENRQTQAVYICLFEHIVKLCCFIRVTQHEQDKRPTNNNKNNEKKNCSNKWKTKVQSRSKWPASTLSIVFQRSKKLQLLHLQSGSAAMESFFTSNCCVWITEYGGRYMQNEISYENIR